MDLNKILSDKLKDKIAQKKTERFHIKAKQQRKIKKDIDEEKKALVSDPRITALMRRMYVDAVTYSPNIENVKNPIYILDNMEESKLKFYEFLTKYSADVIKEVNSWKEDMLLPYHKMETQEEKDTYMKNLNEEYKKKFKTYFINPYISYMSLMTNINIFEDLINILGL
jgi:molecular chaperone DnaK (HSP70)